MLDLEALEQEAQEPFNAQGKAPAPAIPKTVQGKKTNATGIPSSTNTLSQAQLDAEYDSILSDAGIDKGALDQKPEETAMEASTSKGFFKTFWDYGRTMQNSLWGVAQFGTNVSNVSKEAAATVYNKFADKKITVERNTVYSPTDSAEARTWAKMGEIGAPTMIGAALGSVVGTPLIGGPIGGVIGGMIGSFIQDPDEANISTAMQDTKYSKLPVIGNVLNFYAHKPGDSDLIKRMKNMYENGLVDVLGGGAIAGATAGAKAAARSRVSQAAKNVMKEVAEDVRIFSTKKVPTPAEKPTTVPAASSLETGSMQIMDETTLANKEAAYVQQGEQTAHDFAEVVAKGRSQLPADNVEMGGAPSQMDFFEMLGEMEQVNKARKDAVNLDTFQKEASASEVGARKEAKQLSLFGDRPVQVDDPRLSGENLSLFDIDDVDVAGFSYDPKQASFFEAQYNKTLPENFDIPEQKFVELEQMKQNPAVPVAKVREAEQAIIAEQKDVLDTQKPADPGADPGVGEFKVTAADDSIVEKLDSLQQNRQAHYEQKRLNGEPLDYTELQQKASAKNDSPGEVNRILNLPPGYVPNSMEMAQIQDLWIRSYLDKEMLGAKVASGTANDLELVAYKQAQENHYNISMKYYTAGTESSHSLGIRRTIRNYARAGNPLAIQLIGNEGKIKSVGALLQEWGGRAQIQDEAKFFGQVMEMVNNKNSGNVTIGNLTPGETGDLVKQVREMYAKPDSQYLMSRDGEIRVKSRGRQTVDAVTGYMFDNMVLSPITMVNTWAGMPFDFGMRVANNYTMALMSGAKGNVAEMSMRFDKANRYSMSLIKNIKDGLKAGAREFSGQQAPGDIIVSSQGGVPEYLKQYARQGLETANTAALAEVDSVRKILTPTYGWTIGLGRKVLASSDAFVNHLGYNAYVESELLERGYAAGLRGESLDKYISTMSKKPPTDIHDQGLIEGAKLGYRADIDDLGVGGFTPLAGVEEFLYKYPVAKVFAPFFRSYGNTVQNTLEYLPGLTYALKSSRENMEKSIAKQMTGAGALIGMTSLFLDDHITLPDFFQQSPYKKYAEVDENGKPVAAQPMSLRHADGTTTKLPWGGAMQKFGILAGYIAMASKYLPEAEIGAYISGGTMALTQAMSVDDQFRSFNMISDLVTNVSRQQEVGKPVMEFGASIAERFIPFNRIGKDINKAMEENSEGFTVDVSGTGEGLDYLISALDNRLRSVVPGSSESLPPEYNILGEPVPAFGKGLWNIPGLMTVTESKSSAVMEKLSALALHSSLYAGDVYNGFTVPKLAKGMDVGGIPVTFTPNEYARYQAYYGGVDPQTGKTAHPSGLTLRDALSATFVINRKRWEGVSTKSISPQDFNSMVADVNEVFSGYRNWAKEQMKNEPSIIKKVNDISTVDNETNARGIRLIDTVLGR